MRPEVALLSPRPGVRLRAARRARDPLALAWAALTDDDAGVRAMAVSGVKDAAVLDEAVLDVMPLVRASAYRACGRARVNFDALVTAITSEPVWWARRRAVQALAPFLTTSIATATAALAQALGDPFWRVRHTALRAIVAGGDAVVDACLAAVPENAAWAAALTWLERRRERATGEVPASLAPDPQPFRIEGPLFDDDPAVMSARLDDPAFAVDAHTLVLLLGDPHQPLREGALRRLLRAPTSTALRLALTWLEDPRVPHATATALRFLDQAGDGAKEVAGDVLIHDGAHPRVRVWAASYAARTHDRHLLALAPARPPRPPLLLENDGVRRDRAAATARLAVGDDLSDLEHSDDPWLRARAARGSRDPRVAVRLLIDKDPGVRAWARAAAAAVEADALRALVDDRDPRVAAGARALVGVATGASSAALPRAKKQTPAPSKAATTALGQTGVLLPALILSGVNELASPALARAVARGANAFFWEPRHQRLTRFLRGRSDVVVVAGSYEASAAGIERDLARAQKLLGRGCIDVFLLFWARSDERITGEPWRALRDAKARGAVKAIGFSTHLRDLALRAFGNGEQSWDVVMTRHSAAHPGAEAELLPRCAADGVAVLAFSSTSYGRLIDDGVSALDCYSYSLAQEGVVAVVSAPRVAREVDENLAVLDADARAACAGARRDHLLRVGARVHAESKDVLALVRRAPLPPAPTLAAQPEPTSTPTTPTTSTTTTTTTLASTQPEELE